MVPIYLHPELEAWAKLQVSKGVASSVEALVGDAIVVRRRDSDWLDKLFKSTLTIIERDGWIDGDQVMRDMDQWTRDLDLEIEAFETFRAHKALYSQSEGQTS
jgi:hypothetical protein